MSATELVERGKLSRERYFKRQQDMQALTEGMSRLDVMESSESPEPVALEDGPPVAADPTKARESAVFIGVGRLYSGILRVGQKITVLARNSTRTSQSSMCWKSPFARSISLWDATCIR